MGFWEIFKNWIFSVIDWLYAFCGDWGMAIILITIIFRILIFPITARQIKSSLIMQKLQPRIKEIQAKYASDKTRQQEEMMKVYKEAKFNPLSGCLPMILQMPIFIALYQVLLELEILITNSNHDASALPATFYGIVSNLSNSCGTMFSVTPDGALVSLPYLVLVLIFGCSMLLPMLINKTRDRNTILMTGVMTVVMLFIGWGAPAGVLLYWDTSSLIGVGQQFVTKLLMDKKDEQQEALEIEIKPVKVEVERKERKARPRKNK
ncbi:MAG: YidC/Oxa1 family membrane protein insertase [Actinomycetia bacterium]|nr:YidC/Oxa1 family membrane protein insertase [Actinomycetes bacterium]